MSAPTHVIFLRHGARPGRADQLSLTGEAQARAAGTLLRAEGWRPGLAVHTATVRTRMTVRLAFADDPVPTLEIPHAPRHARDIPARLRGWCPEGSASGAVLLCAHDGTQRSVLKQLGLRAARSDRALVVIRVIADRIQLVQGWACPENATTWRPLQPT